MKTMFFARIDAGLNFSHILPYSGAHVACFNKEMQPLLGFKRSYQTEPGNSWVSTINYR